MQSENEINDEVEDIVEEDFNKKSLNYSVLLNNSKIFPHVTIMVNTV